MSQSEHPATLEPAHVAAQAQWVRALALAIVRDAHAADDLAQDTLAAALAPDARPTGELRGWLNGIARNLARMGRRTQHNRAQRERAAARSEQAEGPTDALERLETQELLLRAVRELDEPYRTVVLLRWFEGLEPREIARRSGVPVRTVHTRITRALALLRARLDRAGRDDRSAWMSAWLPLLRVRPSTPTTLVNVMAISGKVVGAGVAACALVAVAWFVHARMSSTVEPELALAASPAQPLELAEEDAQLADAAHAERTPAAGASVPERPAPAQERQSTQLIVRVRDAHGPVEQFAIAVEELGRNRPPHDMWKRSALHPGGEVRLDTNRSDFAVKIQSERHALLVLGPLHASAETQVLDALLSPLALLHGRVLHDDRPVDGARVTLHGAIPAGTRAWHDCMLVRSLDGESAETTSAADGSFELPLRAAGRFWIRARHADLVDGEIGPLELDTQPDGVEHVIELSRGGSIEGLVLLAAGTTSYEVDVPQVDLATMMQYTTKRGRMEIVATRGDGFERVVKPDEQGRFRFDGLMPGAWYVGPKLAGSSSSTTNFDDGPGLTQTQVAANCDVIEGSVTQHDVDLRAGRGSMLTVRFALGERAAAGWNVRCAGMEYVLWSADRKLEDTGALTVDVLPGPCVLHVSGKLGKEASLNVREELALQPGSESWEFRPPVGTVVGRVSDPLRARSGGLELSWRDGAREALCSVALAADGTFRVDDLPAGNWYVGSWGAADATNGKPPAPAFRVVAGATVEVELR